MKRIGNILEATASFENIDAAVTEALHHRSKRNALAEDAKHFMKRRNENIGLIRWRLRSGDIGEVHYNTFHRHEHGKVRKIDWNPSFSDNVMQHAIYRTVGRRLVAKMIADTYSGIKGRGPSYGLKRLRHHIRKFDGRPLYVLKFDIRKFYQSIDIGVLKGILAKNIKDKGMLKVLHAILDSHPDGLPIGNYLSQLLANLYLNDFDHWAQRELGVIILRYCDDVVMLADGKEKLWDALEKSKAYLKTIGLSVKPDAQVFPIERGGIDFMGFVVTRRSVRLRKRIERSFRRSVRRFREYPCGKTYGSLASYYGWTTALSRGRLLWKRVAGKPLKDCLEESRRPA